MNEETIAIVLAAVALAAFLFFTRGRGSQPDASVATPSADNLAQVVSSSELTQGPSYFIANQPYYFAPPISNFMPAATASKTIATNDDGGCGC